MRIKNLMLAATALAVGLTGCNKDDEKYQEGSGLKASISITIPQITTYATDANAVADEVIFDKADVFIYDGSTLETHETLDGATDFQTTGTNEYESITQIETTTGPKEVYVGLNLPASIVNTIVNSGIKAGLAAATQISVTDLINDASNKGFAMFSVQGETGTFVEDTDPTAATANKVSVTVERLVGKVTVQESATLVKTVEGGTVSNLQFAIRNSNKYIYALQQKDGSGNIIDPNWNSYVTSSATTDFESFNDYVAVNASGDLLAALNNKYAPENTSDKHATEESTYASLRVSFAPTTFVDAAGVINPSHTWTAGKDFWTVTLADGTLNYFDVEADADTYETANLAKGAVKNEYAGGYCYYNMFLDLTGGYNTIRNHYYKLTINSIKGLGNPNPEDGGNTPNPVPSSTHIDVDIDIAAWTLVTDGYDL